MTALVLHREARDTLVRLALAAYPQEGCGILAGRREGRRVVLSRAFACDNIAVDRRRNFLVDPLDHLAAERSAEAAGEEVLGIWHSHPDGQPIPSETDRVQAWGGWYYLIAATTPGGLDGLRAWRLDGEHFVEEVINP